MELGTRNKETGSTARGAGAEPEPDPEMNKARLETAEAALREIVKIMDDIEGDLDLVVKERNGRFLGDHFVAWSDRRWPHSETETQSGPSAFGRTPSWSKILQEGAVLEADGTVHEM